MPDRWRTVLRSVRGFGRRVRNRPGARPIVLMYHRVAAPPYDPWGLCVSPERFREHVAFLQTGRRVMRLDDLVNGLASAAFPAFATAITFDDGYTDNLLVAAPMLAEAGLPATLFVTSGAIGSNIPFAWDGPQPEESGALPMSVAQLRKARETFDIGAHARRHEPLGSLDASRQAEEIAGSRRDLARMLGEPPGGFAYPHGDWNRAIARQVAEAGYEWAVAVENRAIPRRFDRFAIPRLTVGDWSAERLAREIRNAGG